MKKLSVISLITVLLCSFSVSQNAQAVSILGGLDFNPNPVNFPNTIVGETSAEQNLQTTHNGIIPLVIFVLTAFIHDQTNFFIGNNNCNGRFLVVGQSCNLGLFFSPQTPGFHLNHVTFLSTGFSIIDFVRVAGKGVLPRVRVRPSIVDFGTQVVMTSSAPTHVRIRSVGSGPLTVTELNITMGGNVFSIDSTNCFDGPIPPGGHCLANIVFTPDAVQEFTGELEVVSNAINGIQMVGLTGEGVPAPNPAITLSTNLVDFDPTEIGNTSGPITVVVTSTGNVDVTISDITSNNLAAFPLSGSCTAFPVVLSPGATCDLDVSFMPTLIGPNTSDITIDSDASDEPELATEGIGFDSTNAGFDLSDSVIDFGEHFVGSRSDPETVTLSNNGDFPQYFMFDFGGEDPHSFALSTECPTDPSEEELQPGESCDLSLTCAPQAQGSLSAELIITDALGITQNITLLCVGLAGDISGGSCSLQDNPSPANKIWALGIFFVLGLMIRKRFKTRF